MSAPKRIQLSRAKGWRKPEGAVVVSRPSKWGNPFLVVASEGPMWFVRWPDEFDTNHASDRAVVVQRVVALFGALIEGRIKGLPVYVPTRGEIRDELAGRDLACWCPLDQPCHADVLLEIANSEGLPMSAPMSPERDHRNCVQEFCCEHRCVCGFECYYDYQEEDGDV